jgi:signal transduction histidine kinase
VLKRLVAALDRSGKTAQFALALAIMAAVYSVDQLVGVRLSLLTFFWVPVALATWYCGMAPGLFLAAVSIGLAIRRDLLLGRHYSHPLFLVWDFLDRGISFTFFVWVLARLKSAYESEGESRRLSQEIERLKSSMLAVMSHEINNAISVLKMSVFLMREHEDDAAARARSLETIDRVLVNMQLAAANFLDNARMESGRLVLKPETVDASAMLKELIAMFSPLFHQRELTVVFDSPESRSVWADRAALSLILSNLIGNAVKYNKEAGRVTVKVEESREQRASVKISVTDTGIGISAKDRKKIVQAFVRLPEGRVMARGYGLGLKTVNEMLLLHGSHLDIESEAGKGSCFSFTLPRPLDSNDRRPYA